MLSVVSAKNASAHPLEGVHQLGELDSRRESHQEMDVVLFAVELHQLTSEVAAHLAHHSLAVSEDVVSEGPSAVFSDEYQMGVTVPDSVSALSYRVVVSNNTKYTWSVLKRYSYRAYPTPGQRQALARTFGCVRVVYNDFVAERERLYREGLHTEVSFAETEKTVTTLAKKTEQRAWLSEVSSTPLQQAARDAHQAYRNWFNSLSGARRGPRVGKPRFKSRHDHRQSARFTRNCGFSVLTTTHGVGKARIPKVGWVRFALSRDLPSEPSSVTVILESDGTYHLSFVVEVAQRALPVSSKVCALDLGLSDLAAVVSVDPETGVSTRTKIANPRPMKAAQRKLAREQRRLSRMAKGSSNRAAQRLRVAKVHSRVRHLRSDHHHQLAQRIVAEHHVIALETLSLRGMSRTRLAKSVSDAGMGTLIRLITEKAESQGRTVVRVDQWIPTTQTCAVCGAPGGKKPLSVREWTCEGCDSRLDRDYNAAVNIMVAAGLAETLNACGADVRHALARAVGDEARTHRTDQTLCGQAA